MMYIFDTFTEAQAKLLANSFIGELGRKYTRTEHGCTCRDMDTAQCIWTSALAEGRDIFIDSYIFLIRERTIERNFSDNTSINRFVISQGTLQCLNLIYDDWTNESELYSVNTDGIHMTNPKKQYPNKKDVKFVTKNIGSVYTTDSVPLYFEKHRENFDTSNYTDYVGGGCIYYGAAGCGKTTKLVTLATKATNPVTLSFTNKAIENIKSKISEEFRDKCHTFDSYFCHYHGRDISSLEGKTVFIEECTMTPNKWMTKIYQAFTKYHNAIYMFGDTNQCDPIKNGSQIHHDYFTSVPISEMCPRRVEMNYKEGCVRYDEQTRDVLAKFLETGKVTSKFAPTGQYYKNICYLNKTRRNVTRECCHRFVEDKESYEIDFLYNSKRERYSVCVGMHMLVTQNLKNDNLFNMMEFKIEHITEDGSMFTIGGYTFEYSKFSQCFFPAFCSTVLKYRGSEIDEHYNISNVNRMDKNQLYTALSRTTKLEYIHLSNELLNKRCIPRQQPHIEILKNYFNSDYNDGKRLSLRNVTRFMLVVHAKNCRTYYMNMLQTKRVPCINTGMTSSKLSC